MGDYTDIDAPPSEPMPPTPPPTSCQIRLTEDFLKSDQFDSIPSLLQACPGDAPVEMVVVSADGQRAALAPPQLARECGTSEATPAYFDGNHHGGVNLQSMMQNLRSGSRNPAVAKRKSGGSWRNQVMANEIVPANTGEFLLYQTEDGDTRVQVRLGQDTVWLSLNQMADLFQRDKSGISKHIANVFEEGELQREAVVANFATTASDGKVYQVDYYNLDVIISIGYRVKSLRGTRFRMWATQRLREYIVKGFTLDDRRLKQAGGGDHFEELLARIRDIRSSERVFWRKVLDIYALSEDYDPRAESSTRFFQTVQNKMHWAITGQTAAEIVHQRADAGQPYMGLTS